jgi:NAD-dependent dihydropyrimidine dehydrogenase PreA subunit
MAEYHEVYQKLAEKYAHKGSENFLAQLKILMTPEEGKLLLELSSKMAPAELAKKLNLDAASLAETLDSMARRGLVYREKGQYLAWPDAHQFGVRVSHSKDKYIPPELAELRKAGRKAGGGMGESSQHLKRFEATGVAVHRVIPSRLAILANPDIKPDQILWYEDPAQLIERNGGYGVVDCPCRRNQQKCDRPLWVCVHFRKNIVEYEVGRDGRMRAQDVKEAIATNDMAEKAGLVHITPYNSAIMPGVICNCCSCCCGVLTGAIASGKIFQIISPSRFQAFVQEDKCEGCQDCIVTCPFDAIEMVKAAGSKKMKARVIKEKCLGCGVCVIQCKPKALRFDLVRPPEHIPLKAVGQAVGSAQVTT